VGGKIKNVAKKKKRLGGPGEKNDCNLSRNPCGEKKKSRGKKRQIMVKENNRRTFKNTNGCTVRKILVTVRNFG